MRKLATVEQPIRASLLPNLFNCPRGFLERTMTDGQDVGNDAAQTGSIVHAGIAEWEKNTNPMKAISLMNKEHRENFPIGDIGEAIRLFQKYVDRSKSDQKGKTIHIEKKINFTFPCSKIDETKEDLVIYGTIDLVKEFSDRYHVNDHKSGRKYGSNMIRSYSPQIAAYVYGSWITLLGKTKKPVKGYITRLQDLIRRDLQFYWDTHIDLDRAVTILETVANRIALLRMGIVDSTPGDWCDWCSLGEFNQPDDLSCVKGNKRVALPLAQQVNQGNPPKKQAVPKMIGTLGDLLKKHS